LDVAQLQMPMKKPLLPTFILLAAVGLFFGGWYFGQQSATKLASNVLQTDMFNHAYTQIADNDVVIQEIDSGRIEDAKNMLYLSMDGNIFALDNLFESTNSIISLADMKILLKIDEGNRSAYGSHQETSNKLLARVAKYRVEHQWTYTGTMSHSTNAELEAKLDSILKRASESQK
jgi:hypothetical protein